MWGWPSLFLFYFGRAPTPPGGTSLFSDHQKLAAGDLLSSGSPIPWPQGLKDSDWELLDSRPTRFGFAKKGGKTLWVFGHVGWAGMHFGGPPKRRGVVSHQEKR